MTVLFFYPALFMILSGFGMYSEATGRDSWQHTAFGWFVDLYSNTIDLHYWHRVGMWTIASFIIIHVYAAIREDIMSGQSVISTMVNGVRMFKNRTGR
jgi:Ni/Fe-hydrogenase 1 B-type cytochrome subunit